MIGTRMRPRDSSIMSAHFTIFSNLDGYNPYIITKGSDGAMWFTNFGGGAIGRITTAVTPAITGFTPTSGAPAHQVTITGHNLSPATKVAFNGTPASLVSDTATRVVISVPAASHRSPIWRPS